MQGQGNLFWKRIRSSAAGYLTQNLNFEKNKKQGVKELHFKNHTLIEAVV